MILPRSILIVVACVAASAPAALAQSSPEPIVAYNFNTQDPAGVASLGSDPDATLTLKNGATYSAAGTGVSGNTKDRALNLLNTIGMGQPPGGIATCGATASLSGLSSFTLTGWFATADTTSINAAARLIDAGSSFFIGGAEKGNLVLGVNGKVASVSGNQFAATRQWVFFAVTYDGTKPDQNVKFYTGSTDSPAVLVGYATDLPAGVLNRVGVLNVGNREFNNFDRPFHGLIDDVKIFGEIGTSKGALDLAQIQKVQKQSTLPPR